MPFVPHHYMNLYTTILGDNYMDINEIKERMYNKKLYFCADENLIQEQLVCLDKLHDYNNLKPSMQAEKSELLKDMLADIGENCYIETPFYSNWGGKNVHFGNNVYANFNLTLVDDCDIFVGNYVMIGPNVTLCSGTHPIEPNLRKKQAQYNLPIYIEDNVWLGANCIIMPGITIGENSVIGAGSIVTKNIPSNVIAVGSPCRILREIDDNDRKYYYKDYEIDIK